MAPQPKAFRVAALTTALAALTAVGAGGYVRWSTPERAVEPFVCAPIPKNIVKLGQAVPAAAAEHQASRELGWPELRAALRPGDRVSYFETPVSAGHLAMRGNCFLGQTVAWVR